MMWTSEWRVMMVPPLKKICGRRRKIGAFWRHFSFKFQHLNKILKLPTIGSFESLQLQIPQLLCPTRHCKKNLCIGSYQEMRACNSPSLTLYMIFKRLKTENGHSAVALETAWLTKYTWLYPLMDKKHRHLFHSKNICPLLFLTSR
jgi:hypothetical protein